VILWINVYIVAGMFLWVLFFPKERQPFAVGLNLMLAGFNAFGGHIVNFIITLAMTGDFKKAYNPGVIQSILMNFPFNFYAMYRLYKAGYITGCHILIFFGLVGLPMHVIVVGVGIFTARFEVAGAWLDHLSTLLILVAVSCVTFLIKPTEKAASLAVRAESSK